MKHLIFCIALVLCLTIAPVMASPMPTGSFDDVEILEIPASQNIVYNAEAGHKLTDISIIIPLGCRSDFTLTYGTGQTISGFAEYEQLNAIYSRTTIGIGANTSVKDFIDAGYVPGTGDLNRQLQITGYAQDDEAGTMGFGIWEWNYGVFSNHMAYEAVSESNRMISGITMSSTLPTAITVGVGTDEVIGPNLAANPLDTVAGWVSFATYLGATIFELCSQFLYWLKFFLWDNLTMTIALYIALTAVMAANSAGKNIFKFIRNFINYQKKLFEFILSMWQRLIDLVATFRGIFRL